MERRDLAGLPYAEALTTHSGPLRSGEDYDTVLFDGDIFDDPKAPGAVFIQCAFTRVSLQAGTLQRARFRDVWLRDVSLTGTSLAETGWLDATFLRSALAGPEAFAASFRRVTFSGCKLDSVNFRDSALTDVTFTDCILRDVDFGGASLTRVSFPRSRLTRTDFSRTAMDRVDLRDAELGVVISPESLRGAIISSGQLALLAPVLAETLGITVSDDQP